MDHVIAKVKRLRKETHFKLISDKTLYEAVKLDPKLCVAYKTDHNLDEDAWFVVKDLSVQEYCPGFAKQPFDIKNYNDLPKSRFTDITYLCAVQGEDLYFQKVTPSLFLKQKTIYFGDAAEVDDNKQRLVVNSQPDAVYYPAIDTLAFKSLATISSIFPGIDELYKEATQEEVRHFLKEPFIKLTNGFDAEKVSKPNRKRIALALETLAALPAQDKQAMISYINAYCQNSLTLDAKTGQFEIPGDGELKLLVYGIEQRFYTTQIGQEKRIANSVQAFG
ncbi:hypothetical protein CLU88_1530 [Acidovorax sp. 56]|jgi:hypothetical protein|nr:hypothetical protein CLU88_1530 [Acidovorax sp. 56]